MKLARATNATAPLIGGLMGVFALSIVFVFWLAVLDQQFLKSGTMAAVVSATLVDLANGDRTSSDVGTLAVSPVLTAVAQAKADDMAQKGYFAHTSPEGKDPWYWFSLEGYAFSYAGENLAVNFTDSATVNTAWMNSPEHRANLLNPHFTQIGIATAEGVFQGRQTTFVVEEFGAPAGSAQTPVVMQTVPAEATTPAVAAAKPAVHVSRPAATSAPARATSTVLGISKAARPSMPVPDVVGRAAASPFTYLAYAYALLALVIIGALAFVTRFEWKRHHLRHVNAALALIVLMLALLAAGGFFVFAQPVLAAV